MGRLLRQHGVRGTAAQAAHFRARKQRLERLDPSLGVFQTHELLKDVDYAVSEVFPAPVTAKPVVFGIAVRITAANPSGVVFEFGDNTFGVALSLDTGRVEFAAGGRDAQNNGVTAVRLQTFNASHVGRLLSFSCAVVPGRGLANVWLDGTLIAAAGSVDSSFSDWAAQDSFGRIGNIDQSDLGINARVSAQGILTGAAIASPLLVAVRQLPRVNLVRGLGTNLGFGVWEN